MDRTPDYNTLSANRYLAAKEVADERYAAAWQQKYTEVMQGWIKSPMTLVPCPDSHKHEQTVIEVVSDYMDSIKHESDVTELYSIIAAAAIGHNVSDRARALMDRIATAHADWHAETASEAA